MKTTTGFSLIYKVLKGITKSDLNLERFCYLFGQLFQIRDDYINLKCEDFHKLKGFAEDLTEGKFSFPIIHGIRKDPMDTTILSKFVLKRIGKSSRFHSANRFTYALQVS